MLNTDLLCRPWSCHAPKVSGYEPMIRGKVTRISKRRKLSWRCEVFVDDSPMFLAHKDTKAAAESQCATMLKVYTDVHYRSK